MIRAVIIDFDDTLCLTEEACFKLENEALRQMGRPPQPRAVHKTTWGEKLFEAIKVRSPGVDVPEFKRRIIATQDQWVREGRIDAITPENLHALDELRAQGKQLYILTSRTHSEITHLLEPSHHLAERITAFYYHEVMPFHKPDPRAFDPLLQEHNLKPEECVYIGDSPNDAAAAKGAHLHFIACLEAGIRTKTDFSQHEVDQFIDRFSDAPTAVVSAAEHP